MSSSRIICVLSPPRSGSSLTTRIINILGVHMGITRDFDEPNKHNQKGFLEHLGIQEINNEVMSRLGYDCSHLGADWTEPLIFPDNWEMNSQLSDLKEQAQNIIHQNFAEYDVWGWKDPRTCFTLPFWQSILPQIKYVILLRNPVDVARSLERFIDIGCSFERGLYMWLLYLHYAFKHTSGQNRIILNVEDWTSDWQGELSRLADFLGTPELVNNTSIQDAVHELVDRSLWHSTSSRALSTVNNLYEQLFEHSVALEKDSYFISQDTLNLLAVEALSSDADKRLRDKSQWKKQLTLAIDELLDLTPPGSNLVLVENNQIGKDIIKERNVKLFIEQDGGYGGCPSNSDEAIEEFKQLHTAGAEYIAFAWPAFWWLDYYPKFHRHLRSKFRCILQNDQLVVFDLQS